jgi:hypothetical protein
MLLSIMSLGFVSFWIVVAICTTRHLGSMALLRVARPLRIPLLELPDILMIWSDRGVVSGHGPLRVHAEALYSVELRRTRTIRTLRPRNFNCRTASGIIANLQFLPICRSLPSLLPSVYNQPRMYQVADTLHRRHPAPPHNYTPDFD